MKSTLERLKRARRQADQARNGTAQGCENAYEILESAVNSAIKQLERPQAVVQGLQAVRPDESNSAAKNRHTGTYYVTARVLPHAPHLTEVTTSHTLQPYVVKTKGLVFYE